MSDPRKLSAVQFVAAFILLPLTWLIAGPVVVIALSAPILLALLSVAARALVRGRDWGTTVLISPGLPVFGYILWSVQNADGADGVAAVLAAAVVGALQFRLAVVLMRYDLERIHIGPPAEQQDVSR